MGNDLGRGSIGFEGAGLIMAVVSFWRFMAEKFGHGAALARMRDRCPRELR
jgi:hypothetical protein